MLSLQKASDFVDVGSDLIVLEDKVLPSTASQNCRINHAFEVLDWLL